MTETSAEIIPFPDAKSWDAIARRYADYALSGDPRAACFYLEHVLGEFRLSRPPAKLCSAIQDEFRRRGLRGPLRF